MSTRFPKDRVLFFASIMFLQVAIQVAVGLSMYVVYNMAKWILSRVYDFLPNRLVPNLWQMGLFFVVLG